MAVARLSPTIAIPARAAVGEGPVWDSRSGLLCWVDLAEGTLFESDLESGSTTATATGTLLGAAVPRASSPGFAVAVGDGFGFVIDGALTVADPVLVDPRLRMNDGKCDARGRLWAGSTTLDFQPDAGRLHVWTGAGPSAVATTGFTLPNGLGWDAGNSTMYVDDSVRGVMFAAEFDLDVGLVGPMRPIFQISGGLPDGLAVDVDGCLWVAMWAASEVRRYRPDGTLDTIVAMPVSQPTSCAFGEDGVLFITSASHGVADAEPHAGGVFAVATNTAGVPIARFAG